MEFVAEIHEVLQLLLAQLLDPYFHLCFHVHYGWSPTQIRHQSSHPETLAWLLPVLYPCVFVVSMIPFNTDSTDTHKIIINKCIVDSIQDRFN